MGRVVDTRTVMQEVDLGKLSDLGGSVRSISQTKNASSGSDVCYSE